MPQWAIDRAIARYGTAHPHADLDPRRTALIVIDLQNAYMIEGMGHAVCPQAVAIVPNVNRLASAVRRTGGAVYWIMCTQDDSWMTISASLSPEKAQERVEALTEGSPGHRLHAGLVVEPQDKIVLKYRYSAFLPESCDLAVRLRAAGYDTVLITGTLTNVCCESSARDAMMMNFHTVMVSDANAARTDEEHEASLFNIYVTFGDVMATDFLIERLEANALQQAAE